MPNKKPSAVPNRVPAGDARTRRTHRALGEALVALMVARDFEEITVQDVLDRAGIGRTTFYAHFRNKEDLLLSDTERFIRLLDTHFSSTIGASKRVAPLGELAAHVGAYAKFAAALKRSGQNQEVLEIIIGAFAGIVERRLTALGVQPGPGELPLNVSSRLYAASAITLMEWWLDRDCPISAQELDAKFHTMVWRGVGGGRDARSDRMQTPFGSGA
jgi:AcrR family transcriptional regulator